MTLGRVGLTHELHPHPRPASLQPLPSSEHRTHQSSIAPTSPSQHLPSRCAAGRRGWLSALPSQVPVGWWERVTLRGTAGRGVQGGVCTCLGTDKLCCPHAACDTLPLTPSDFNLSSNLVLAGLFTKSLWKRPTPKFEHSS